jgi:4-amino-4-deoxy-L-arabinose transferase-like glycosyltransferase
MKESPSTGSDCAEGATAPGRRLANCWYWAVLAAILVGALYLRWENVNFGLPALYHPDEDNKVRVVTRFYQQGTADPDYFKHPAFLLYSLAGVGWVVHLFSESAMEPPTIYVVGRAWVGLLGGLTVLLTFFLTREAAAGWLGSRDKSDAPPERSGVGWRANLSGLIAAGLLAVTPLHVIISHYIKEDVPLAFWSTLALIFYLRIARAGRRRDYVLGALFTGMALATKYSGVGLLPLFFAAHLLYVLGHREEGWPWGGALRIPGNWKLAVPVAAAIGICVSLGRSPGTYAANVMMLAALAFLVFRPVPTGKMTHWKWPLLIKVGLVLLAVLLVFVVVNPYAVLNADRFLEDFSYERNHALRHGHQGLKVSPWQYFWGFHLAYSLLPGMGWPLLILALAAAVGLLVVPRPGVRTLQLAALLWYVMHEASYLKPAPNFDRYMAPVLPPLCALAGLGLVLLLTRGLRWAGDAGGRRRLRSLGAVGAFSVLLGAVAVPAAVRSWQLLDQLVPDTRDTLAGWLREHVPPGAVLVRTQYTGRPSSTRFRILRPRRLISERGHRLDLATGWFAWPDRKTGKPRRARLDYVVLSSYWVDRFRRFEGDGQESGAAGHRFYADLIERWGPPVKIFRAPLGPYGFNNPTIWVYRNPASKFRD